MTSVTIDSLDLAALLCSRVCHDVIGPVGAIVNGIEILDEEKDASMKEVILDTVRSSAANASARLQFARMAFGASGGAGAAIDLADAEAVARGMFKEGKIALSWTGPRAFLTKSRAKLLLNLLLIAQSTIPRGGSLAVVIDSADDETTRFSLTSKGINARIPPHVEALMAGEHDGPIDAHVIQPFYAGMIARDAAMRVTVTLDGDTAVIQAARN